MRPRGRQARARRVRRLLASLGTKVHLLDAEIDSPDLLYAYDPLIVSDRGAIPLRPGKPNRVPESAAIEGWTSAHGIPTAGRIEAPGTIEGGDTFWLRPDLFCIGRTLRTNQAGARPARGARRAATCGSFDVPYWKGPAELVHLMSVISPIADDLAVVFMPLLPVGLWQLLRDLGYRLIEVPEEEYPTLGCNVLAVRPGVVIAAEGNPVTAAAMAAAGVEVHTYPAFEIGMNGSGGPTCMTRPILRGMSRRASRGAARDRTARRRTPSTAAGRPTRAALVRVPSITGDEGAVQDLVATLLADAGARVERLEVDPAAARADPDWPGDEMPRERLPIVLGRLGRPGGRRVVLVGHVDVVPVGDLATWTHDPWAAERDGNRVYGRGAVDMKGGVASILGAVRALVRFRACGAPRGRDSRRSVPSEEDGGQGMLAAIRAGVTGDVAVITEPTGLDVVIAHAGAITFKLTVPGRAAHASVRREGVSALDNLQTLVRALEADETARNSAETDPLMTVHGLPYATIIGKVSGGAWASIGDRPDRGRGPLRREARPDLARRGARPPALHRRRQRVRSVPARPSRDRRADRREVLVVARPGGPPAAGRARRGRATPCSAASRSSPASRTAPTCACSSTRATPRP